MSIFDWTPNNLRGDIETASRLVDGEPFRGSIRKGTLVLISQRRLRRLLEAAKKAADRQGTP